MKQILKISRFRLQQALLFLAWWCLAPFMHHKFAPGLWVVVGSEIASNLRNVGNVLQPSITVCIGRNRFYDYRYSFTLRGRSKLSQELAITLGGPLLLAYLLHRAENFFYIGGEGFLHSGVDGRAFELRFLKERGKHLVCSFLGSEIRSPKLLQAYASTHQLDVITTYQNLGASAQTTVEQERKSKNLAQSADLYADQIFNAPVDQRSYLSRKVHPPVYFVTADQFAWNGAKFGFAESLKIVHAPSSPLIKGTPLVRAAIKKLKLEGYNFDYIELMGVPNSVVIQTLRDAHIVLNQFYAFLPGQFGVEALASHTALLTSADENIEPSLPPGSNSAWLVTPYWLIYDNLKLLLENMDLVRSYADRGFEWACTYCDYEAAGRRLRELAEAGRGDN